MKVGDVVCFRGQDYRVGICRTETSIELVELEHASRGLWVSRDEVHEKSLGSGQSCVDAEPRRRIEQARETETAR